MPDEKRQTDPRPLSTEYHKAHKQLMLWSAILFIWELVGIDLEKAKESGGNAGAIISAIKSPQAVPWALMILVGYFLFKTTVEWYQCSVARRTLRVARIDFAMAWTVPLLAYALYAFQAIRKVQIADVVQGRGAQLFSIITAALCGLLVFSTARTFLLDVLEQIRDDEMFKWGPTQSVELAHLIANILALPLFMVIGRMTSIPFSWRFSLWGFLGGLMGGSSIVLMRRFASRGRNT